MGNETRLIDAAIDAEPPSRPVKGLESAATDQAAPLPLAREEFAPRRRSDGRGELIDSRGTGIVLGDLSAADRSRVAEILRGSKVFSAAEIDVALELFDGSVEERGTRNEEVRHPASVRDPDTGA